MLRPFVLVVNPRAAAGRAREKIPDIEHALHEAGAVFETVLTRSQGDATTRVREALGRGASGVAVVGGDGTFNEAINGFFSPEGDVIAPDAWFGPLPCGTGGDFRKTLGLSRDTNAMVTRMMWAQPRPIDIGWLTFRSHEGQDVSRAFLNISSFGMGGLVDQIVNTGPKWIGGKPAFFLGTVRAAARYRNRKVRITVDDDPPRESEIVNVAVANGRFFGGGMHIAPEARIDDGLFDIVSLEGMSLLDQVRIAKHLYRGTILQQRGVYHRRGRRVVAEVTDWEGPVLLDVDGEAPGSLPAVFEVRRGAVRIRA